MFIITFTVVFLCILNLYQSVKIGDEQYGNLNGNFWIWTNTDTFRGANIIDPSSGTTLKTIPVTEYSTMTWSDAVFMRDQAQIKKYAFIADKGNNLMWVYDTEEQVLITKVKTGSKPVHVYGIPVFDEVWAHLDGTGSFDVFHMNQVRYRSSSDVARNDANIGHGKLLTNPNLERDAFSTNTKNGTVTKLDTLLRRKTATLTISNSTIASTYGGFTCIATHGIAFSNVDNGIYVECQNPSSCTTTYNTASCNTGSIWKIDTNTFPGSSTETDLDLGMNTALPSRSRLFSPSLSSKYGISNFGIQGQPYASPEEQFILCANKNLNILSIIKPVAGSSPLVLEVEVNYKPGSIVFWPKDSSITFGVDPNPGNYWAVMALESPDENGGLAFLDMDLVVKGFAASDSTLDKNVVQYVKLGAGKAYRPIKRGNDYIVTPIYDSILKRYTQLAIVNARTRAVTTIPLAGTVKILWVPTFQSSWSSSFDALSKAVVDQNDKIKEAIAVGGVALAFTLGGFCALTALVLYIKIGNSRELLLHMQNIKNSGGFKSVDSVDGDIQNV